MTKKEFIEEIGSYDSYDAEDIAHLAISVTDSQEVADAGQNYLIEIEQAKDELERALSVEGIAI